MNNELKISTRDLVHWFNTLRGVDRADYLRVLESFWQGQLDSKCWLVNELNRIVGKPSNIYVFGGWTGVLSNMLFNSAEFEINRIRSVDIDPWCENIADGINKRWEMADWRFKAVTSDMADYQYQDDLFPDIVINTSTEHVTQDVYDRWYSNIPYRSIIVAQGNNFHDHQEHIRCAENIEIFKEINKVNNLIFEGSLETNEYTRWMCIWKK